ncbi:TIGD6-like protein, partial [Mya arenaria]
MAVGSGRKTKRQIAEDFSIPQNTLSTWLKTKNQIKANSSPPERKLARTAKRPELEAALLKWFKGQRAKNSTIDGDTLKGMPCSLRQILAFLSLSLPAQPAGWVDLKPNMVLSQRRSAERPTLLTQQLMTI